MKHQFIKIIIREKGFGDLSDGYCAFLDFYIFKPGHVAEVYQLRGFGNTLGAAADAAYARYESDNRQDFVEEYWDYL